jgi:nicotinamidase-related amidase
MKRWKKIFVWVLASTMLVAILFFSMVYWSMRPTTGEPIDKYLSPKTALLIIDIQEDFTGSHAKKPYRDGDRIVSTSNTLLAQAKEKGIIIIYIENVIDNLVISALMGGINAPGSPGSQIDSRIIKIPGSKTFSKNRSDAFSTPDFDAYLREKHVDHLLVTGLDAAYCVNATIQGALNRGYKVTVYSEGIATESGKSIDKLTQGWRQAGVQVKGGAEL